MLKRIMIALTGCALLCNAPAALAIWSHYNLPVGVTPISHDIYHLHMTIFWVCVGIAVAVFSVLIYSLIHHRKSRGAVAASFHENPKLEIAWTIVPFLILVLMAIPATKVLLNMDDDSQADVNIKITGYQWKWKYDYLDEGISYFSNLKTAQDEIQNKVPKSKWYLLEVDKPLIVPIHKKIRFLVTANDVIHSWWVPELGIKRDAIPGFIHESWARIDKPGTYRGQCAELCGIGHAYMPIVVIAKTESDYNQWLLTQHAGHKAKASVDKQKVWTKTDLMKQGKEVYATHCAVCHKESGVGMPPAFPAIKGGPIPTGPLAAHINIVVHGKQGTAMQAFGEQLSNEDIAAVITYQRNAWGNADQSKYGNNAGGIVQPQDIEKAK